MSTSLLLAVSPMCTNASLSSAGPGQERLDTDHTKHRDDTAQSQHAERESYAVQVQLLFPDLNAATGPLHTPSCAAYAAQGAGGTTFQTSDSLAPLPAAALSIADL